MSNRRSISAVLACVFGYICNLFLDPIVSVRLIDLGMPEKVTGVAFAIFGFAMILMSPITGRLCERFQNRYILQCGLIVETLALFFAGPDFFLPPRIYLVLFAMFLLGMSESLILIPVTPEIIESCTEMIKDDLTKQFEMEQDSLTDSEVQIDVEEMVDI